MEEITCPLCKEGVLLELAPQYLKNVWKCSAAKCQTVFKMTDWHPASAEGRILLILAHWDRTTGEWTGESEIEITPE